MVRHLAPLSLALLLTAASLGVPRVAGAADIWSGRTFAFSKAAFANPALAANQDRIRPTYWITRGSTKGLFNAARESFFTTVSPMGTEWANGDAVNYLSLNFTTWDLWVAGNPPAKVNVNAVVHLIDDDIYIDIVMDSWAEGAAGGGAFSYHRGVQPVATPAKATSWGRIKSLYR